MVLGQPGRRVEAVVADDLIYDVVFDEYNRVFVDPDHGDIEVVIDGVARAGVRTDR